MTKTKIGLTLFEGKITQIVIALLAYIAIFNFVPRSDFVTFFSLYTLLFISYYFLYQHLSLKLAIGAAVLFRLIGLLSIPELSDDFYRFIWDGALSFQNINPYLYTPQEIINSKFSDSPEMIELFQKMNSPNYFTVYPPLNQILFFLSVSIFGFGKGLISAIGIKFWIFLAEIGTILLLPKLLRLYNIEEKNAVIYLLNPLVIIELCGNGHYEGVMIFLLLLAIYFLKTNKWWMSAILFGMAVSIKLIPLLFLPLLLRKIGLLKLVLYTLIVITINGLLFIPFASQDLVNNMGSRIHLYFNSFQFNSFIFSIVSGIPLLKELPVNEVKLIAPALMIFPIGALAWFSLSKTSMLKNLPAKMSMSQAFYYFFAAVIHPWYLTTVLVFSTFHPVKYILVWSYVIGLSYFTYRTIPYEESSFVIALEYLLVFIFLFVDWIKLKRKRYQTN